MLPLPKLTYIQDKRFWARIDKQGPDECWNWTGDFNDRGYGRFSIKDRGYKAHRIAYALHFEYDPVNQRLYHTCGNPACCNPAHLTTLAVQIGIDNGTARLTEAEGREIRALDLQGVSLRELGRQFDVAPNTIKKIVDRKTWRHI